VILGAVDAVVKDAPREQREVDAIGEDAADLVAHGQQYTAEEAPLDRTPWVVAAVPA